jgi:hypothetical protein
VTLSPPHGPTLLDVSMIHTCCLNYIAAASKMRGTAAALRDRSKGACGPSAPRSHLCTCKRQDVRASRQAHHAVLFMWSHRCVETYGHLSKLVLCYLRALTDIARPLARSLVVTRRSIIASAHRKLSVALVQSQGYVYRSCVRSSRLRGCRCCLG